MKKTPKTIVFYDGECGFCNRSVQFILKFEKGSTLHFSTLHSDFAQRYFAIHDWAAPQMNTFYLAENGLLYDKSEAAFHVLRYLKIPMRILGVFSLLPQWLCDQVYDWVARNRKRLMKSYCHIPTSGQRKRFLH